MSEELKAIRERHEADENRTPLAMNFTFYSITEPPRQAGILPEIDGEQAHADRATLLSLLTASQARAEAAEARVGELEEPAAFARFVLRWLFHKEAENPKQFRELVINHPPAQAEARTLKGAPDGR